jgi:hypothetical protein
MNAGEPACQVLGVVAPDFALGNFGVKRLGTIMKNYTKRFC